MKKLILLVFLLTGLVSRSQLYPVPISSATSLQLAQPGEEINKAIDGDNNTMYHSKWYQKGIPDELLFYFTQEVSSINKIVYTPRQSGGLNGIWTKVSVYYSTQNAPTNFIPISENLIWADDSTDKVIDLTAAIQNPYAIKFKVDAGHGDFSSCAEMRFYKSITVPFSNGVDCAIPTATLNSDTKVSILANGSFASSFQGGENINGSFDNDLNTLYHSNWSGGGFPILLNYHFDGSTPIDYLKYIPRLSGNNGYFGKVTISYNTLSNSVFQPLMDADFGQSGQTTYIQFPSQITPLNIQISVKDGKNNFASCAEMEFYTANAPYSNLFANNIYSALQPSVTQTDINAIQDPFFKSLAQCLFDKTYVSKYRVQSYQVYTKLSTISKNLKVWSYDSYENPTGIVFEQGEKVALFVRNIPAGLSINLLVKDFETEIGGTSSAYALRNGLNTFNVTNKGLGYIQYYNDNPALPNVEINIVSGKINGYYDSAKSSKDEWPELLSRTTYPMIDVVGQNAHLVYRKDALQTGSPFDPKALIDKYDIIIAHERMLMGLYKYNKAPKNHQFGYSNHGGGYYAGGGGVNLDIDWGVVDLTNPDKLGLWGIAHEFGHVNQIGPDLDWIGMSEVTNNIYSVWVGYNMNSGNHPYSRLEESQDAPATGMNSIAGGLINGNIFNTHVNGEALQGNSNSNVFKILVPFWQLELYYQLAGASRNAPILSFDYPQDYTGVDYAHWYGMVAEIARNSNSSGLNDGELLLNFVKNTCDVVQEDLTDFFKKAGFLVPIDKSIDDYAIRQLTITQAQIDATIASIKGKNYAAPVSPVIDYISAHSISMFRNKLPLSGQTGLGVSLNNNYLTVQHSQWHNAVAYETYDTANKLIFVSISGTGDLTNQSSKVYYPSNAGSVYAVGFDGKKILVYPAPVELFVSFNTNGGSNVDVSTVAFNQTVSAPAQPTKTGYSFAGWYKDSALTIAYDFNSPVTADFTLYAKWTINNYQVSFITNSENTIPNAVVAFNQTVSAPAQPTKTGYTFAGWYKDSELTTAYDFNSPVIADLSLYAKWTINNYLVSFVTNSNSKVDSQNIAYSGFVIKPSDPKKAGFSFEGWYLDSAFVTGYDFSSPVTANLTLYAKWRNNKNKVSFSTNSDSVVDVQYVDSLGLVVRPTNPTKSGFVFESWFKEETLMTPWDFDSDFVIEDTVLYAKWNKEEKLGIVMSTLEGIISIYLKPVFSAIINKGSKNVAFNRIQVIDMSGKVVLEKTDNSNQIDVQNLANGIYILRAQTQDEIYQIKFVK